MQSWPSLVAATASRLSADQMTSSKRWILLRNFPKAKGAVLRVLGCWDWHTDVALGHDLVDMKWWNHWMCGMHWNLQEFLEQFLEWCRTARMVHQCSHLNGETFLHSCICAHPMLLGFVSALYVCNPRAVVTSQHPNLKSAWVGRVARKHRGIEAI